MLAAVGAVITLVVVLSGNNGTSAVENLTEESTKTEPLRNPVIGLYDFIMGAFASASFDGTWTGGSEVLLINTDNNLVLYDVNTESTTVLLSGSSETLHLIAKVMALAPDRSHVVLATSVEPVGTYSFHARYIAVNIANGLKVSIKAPSAASTNASKIANEYLQNFIWGPNGTSLAFVYGNNIFYQHNLEAAPVQITTSGAANKVYNGIPDWIYEEAVFESNNAMWFSADGSKLAYVTFDDTAVRIMKVPHYVVPDQRLVSTQHEIRYPKPGTPNPTVQVTIKDLNSDSQTVYTAPSGLNEPILRQVRFVSNETIALMWVNRVQNALRVELCTFGSASCSQIYEYTEPNGWIDNIPLHFNEAGNSFITILPQSVNGVLYKQIVQVSKDNNKRLWTAQNRINVAHTVLDILLWTSNDVIWYKATHVNDSAEQHIYTSDAINHVSCFSCNIRRQDGGQCLYNEATISEGASRVALNCAGPDVPKVYIYSAEGTYVRTWDENIMTGRFVASKIVPEIIRLQVPVADGFPDADVHIQVPPNYQQRTDVPLLVYVYGAPGSSQVTKEWAIDFGTSLVSRWNIAVAHIDGRGSGRRGVANTFALNRALGKYEIEDQINVTRYLHNHFSWLDSNRTCIWGWSYGGYAASLALARGGSVFRCAAAVAPVATWEMYESIYTERYLDTPQNNKQAYYDSTLLTAKVLEEFRNKRYFLVHGTADKNVHYQHAMWISKYLQMQNIYFTQMSYTDEAHGFEGVRPHLYSALEKFFQENML